MVFIVFYYNNLLILITGCDSVPAKESPIKSIRSRKVVDRQPGNMTFQQRQNLFRNNRSNLYLEGELKRNKRKL